MTADSFASAICTVSLSSGNYMWLELTHTKKYKRRRKNNWILQLRYALLAKINIQRIIHRCMSAAEFNHVRNHWPYVVRNKKYETALSSSSSVNKHIAGCIVGILKR